MLLTSISWTNRIWALPFLTILAPSESYHEEQGKPHKTISDWGDPKGKLAPTAVACTNLETEAIQIAKHYLKRWQVEITFKEVRVHLGVETQRQWSDLNILRSTSCLMALFSIVTI